MSPDHLVETADEVLLVRRRALRTLLTAVLLPVAAVLAGCANRQPLPPERRTRGRFGNGRD